MSIVKCQYLSFAAVAWTVLLLAQANAATFNIPDADPEALKTAIIAANSNGEDDTIHLAAGGSYVLTEPDNGFNGLPVIAPDNGRKLDIEGHGATIRCSPAPGGLPFGIFEVASGADVTMLALTIQNGSASGIFCASNGRVSLQECAVIGNTGEDAGGITNSGALTATATSFTGNTGTFGGAIGSSGSAVVTRCTFSDNVAADGGAIYVGAFGSNSTLSVQDCTFSLNTAPYDIGGGAIFAEADQHDATIDVINSTFDRNSTGGTGGGICSFSDYFSNVNITLTNCTFFGNSAFRGGAIFDRSHGDGDAFSLIASINCTFSANTAQNSGGVIYDDSDRGASEFRIGNTILKAGSSGGTLFAHTVSLGHNLCSDSGGGFQTAPGDQINIDPKLDPNGLQDNGGLTKTIALQPDSPAIDTGNDASAPHRDQRGYFRTGRSDVGAFEYNGGLIGWTSIVRNGNDVIVSAEVVIGNTYRLERKLAISDTDWQRISGVNDLVASGNDTESITDSNAVTLGKAFYHVVVLP